MKIQDRQHSFLGQREKEEGEEEGGGGEEVGWTVPKKTRTHLLGVVGNISYITDYTLYIIYYIYHILYIIYYRLYIIYIIYHILYIIYYILYIIYYILHIIYYILYVIYYILFPKLSFAKRGFLLRFRYVSVTTACRATPPEEKLPSGKIRGASGKIRGKCAEAS